MPRHEIRLFCTDVDGTLVGDMESAQRFTMTWESISRGRRPLLVYNTVRSVLDLRTMMSEGSLPRAEYVIGGIGTEFFETLYNRPSDFHTRFGESWDVDSVERIVGETSGVQRQRLDSLATYKTSWMWHNATAGEVMALEERLSRAGIRATVLYSGSRDLDVIPADADMGRALSWLCERLNVSCENVVVAGASEANVSMFSLRGVRRILVGNARSALRAGISGLPAFESRHDGAEGVLEGLRAFGVLDAMPA